MSHNLNFQSFEDFIETMKRGNEVQFRFCQKIYGVFPVWSNCSLDSRFGEIIGVVIGESYSNRDNTVSLEELPDYCIDGKRFYDAFQDFEIIERTI